jgi:DNA-binding transcriptional regulator YbjK
MSAPAKSTKGKRSREALLVAAITLIARDGLEAVSHRAVAIEADVSTALTTYYFASKTDLLVQAFEYFAARGEPRIAEIWTRAHAILEQDDAVMGRMQTIARLADLATDYVCRKPRPEPDGVAFELAFLYAPRLEPELAKVVRGYRERILASAISFCERAGSQAPHTDAELLIGAILRLEFEQLSVAVRTSRDHVRMQLERLLALIVGPRG